MKNFAFIKRAIRQRASLPENLGRALLAIAIPTALRWLIDRGELGAPFVLYFPAILMIAVLLGWRWGTLTAVGSGLVAAVLFLPPQLSVSLSWQSLALLVLFALSTAIMIIIGSLLRTAVLEIDGHAQQAEDFNRELQHRTKNSLQIMRALAGQASRATDPAEFYATLSGRLAALAKANELLRFGALRSCEIAELVGASIAPFAITQFKVAGPDAHVSREACTPLMMALHELATNATKFGALSRRDGRVEIVWTVSHSENSPDDLLTIDWIETGGPIVAPPMRKGLGSRLLSPNGGMRSCSTSYPPEGAQCRIIVERGEDLTV